MSASSAVHNSRSPTSTESDGLHMAPWLLSDWGADQWLIAHRNGKPVAILFDWLMPDGTRLSEPVNERVCMTIKLLLFAVRTGPFASLSDGMSQRSTFYELRTLACWMQIQGIHRFSHLTERDLRRYLLARLEGKERALQIPERVASVLATFQDRPHDLPKPAEIFELAGVDRRDRRQPISLKLIDSFRHQHGLNVNLRQSKNIRTPGITQSSANATFVIIRYLWDFAHSLSGDGLNFDPNGSDYLKKVSLDGKPNKRTGTAPSDATMYLIEAACDWVFHIGPMLLDVRDRLQHFYTRYCPHRNLAVIDEQSASFRDNIYDNFNSLVDTKFFSSDLVNSRAKGGQINFTVAVNGLLPAACAIVIAAFTARRAEEILTLQHDCIVGDSDGFWMRSYIEKTLQSVDATPCPAIVAKATALLSRWSQPVREANGDKQLFQVPGMVDHSEVSAGSYRFGEYLKKFSSFVRTPKLDDESEWNFTPHQFRRFFAITYIWRFDGADYGALTYQLRHFNIEATRRYVTDAEMGRILKEEGRSYTVSKLMAIAQGDSKPGGTMGKRMERHIHRLRKTVDVAGDRDMQRKVERAVDSLGIVLRGTPWGYCGCKDTAPARRRAKCLRPDWKGGAVTVDGYPDVGGSSETNCMGCVHNMVDQLRKPRWSEEAERLERSLADPKLSPILRAAAEDRLRLLRTFIASAMS